MEAIKVLSVTKKYKDVVAVDDVSLVINHGELFSLLGVNGAGKTTLIKILSCLTQPTSGEAFLHDKSILKDTNSVKSLIAVSPQESAVAKGLSVKENLTLMCRVHGFSKEKTNSKVSEITKLFSLDDCVDKKPSKLSGGYIRRLSIAMALITEPKILFLDEPTLGLDVIARAQLWDIITKLKGKVTIILTTHYMEEARTLSDRIGIMKQGRLLLCDTCDNIMKKADTDNFEQAFIRIVEGEVL